MIKLKENRVYRPFVGGKLLDEFNSNENAKDGHFPERWICSTTKTADGKGVSVTDKNKPLSDFIGEPLDILVKLIDSYTRLMLQVHPNDEYAQEHFNSKYGKKEAWYILDTRVIDGQEPYVFLGFKKGVTKQKWAEIFEKQDIAAMEDCLHKIYVEPGDTFLIPGKVPHAMGSGVFFAEVQQPTDITLRTERRSPDGREMSELDLHCGTSYEVLFNCFDYNGDDLQGTLAKYKVERVGNAILKNELFEMWEINISQGESYKLNVNKYAIVIVIEGKSKGEEYFLTESCTFDSEQKLLVFFGKHR